jgi:hypothetical protein
LISALPAFSSHHRDVVLGATQYEKLGLADFAANYVRGFLSSGSYETVALEIMEAEVQWIDACKF